VYYRYFILSKCSLHFSQKNWNRRSLHFIMLHTVHYASYCTLCFILYIMHHTVHYASYCSLCFILYIMLHTVHYASYCTLCFILYIMLHTVHYATRHTVELSIVSTHHNRGGKYVNKLALFIKKTRSFPFRYTIIKGPSPKNM
jgi:hypothetical protein